MKPWEKWTPEDALKAIESGNQTLLQYAAYSFAALLQAEREGKRCVLPGEVADKEIFTSKSPHGWLASLYCDPSFERMGDTQEAAILNLQELLTVTKPSGYLAAKIRGEG